MVLLSCVVENDLLLPPVVLESVSAVVLRSLESRVLLRCGPPAAAAGVAGRIATAVALPAPLPLDLDLLGREC